MKIAIDVRVMSSKPSGVGIYTYHFLKELLKADHEIVLLTDIIESPQIIQMEQMGIPISCYGHKVYQSIEVINYFRFINRKLGDIQPDLFWEPNAIIPIKLTKYAGKIMITVHDLFPMTHKEYFSWKYRSFFDYGLKSSIRQADYIIYNSAETMRITENRIKGAKDKKSHLGYCIVESKAMSSPSFINHYDSPFFLYVGNIEKRKGLDLLIKAYEDYYLSGGKNALYLVGKMREPDLEKLINETQQRCDRLYYLGYVDEGELGALLRQCACFVFPSRAEGFGIPVIEAMQYERPIIVSELSIFREILGNCVNYFAIEQGDAVKQLSLCMKSYKEAVDVDQYRRVRDQYCADRLGEHFRQFISEISTALGNRN